MIPVTQTVFGPRGNCMAACWSSILEIPIDRVPDYQAVSAAGGSWMNAVNVWLSRHHGQVYFELERYLAPRLIPVGWHLINGDGPEQGDGGHSCVGFMGRLVWDPHPRRSGLKIWQNYGVLVPLTKELRATWERLWPSCQCPECAGALGPATQTSRIITFGGLRG